MTRDRAHPFTLVFGELAPTRLPVIEAELRGETSLEAFLFSRAAVELLGELRPDDGIGEAIDDFVVFVHAAFLYWAAGEHTAAFDEAGTRDLCRATSAAASQPRTDRGSNAATRVPDPAHAMYIQIAPRLVWGQLTAGEHFEPLDGWFDLGPRDPMQLVACFGVHPSRPGLSVLSTAGARPIAPARDDGSILFAPTMPGGDAAGLYAVTGADELLLMAGRAIDALKEM